ncbi:MAG: hypothetical protein AB1578_10955 [Thermodesulfobacteriota bacterium]
MKVASQPHAPIPVTARVGLRSSAAEERVGAAPARNAPGTADRVEISAEALRAAAGLGLETTEGRTGEPVRDQVSRANRDAAQAVQRCGASSLEALRHLLG